MKTSRYFILALLVVIIDQISKLLIHKYMYLHEEVSVISYGDLDQYGFKLHYLLNEGMAFGFKLNSKFGKFILTVFRIGAMAGIGFYLWKMARKNMHPGFLWCMALILGGAIGNVIDSTFYGVLLHNQPIGSPTPWFHGQVIDMLYFPLFEFTWPEWVPYLGGENFQFFRPVFNIADSSIFIGVVIILTMQKRFFKDQHRLEEQTDVPEATPEQNVATTEENVTTNQSSPNPELPDQNHSSTL